MMENKNCVYCKQEINPLRVKALPNTKTCVNCSKVGAKKGMSMVYGEKDHTWNDMIIIESDNINQIELPQQPEFTSSHEIELKIDEDDISIWDITLSDELETDLDNNRDEDLDDNILWDELEDL